MATSKQNSKPDSDLVKLVRELETKRQAKAAVQKDLDRIADDLKKVYEYYSKECQKLEAQRKAAHREMNVANVHLANVEEVAREHGLLGGEVNRGVTAVDVMLREWMASGDSAR